MDYDPADVHSTMVSYTVRPFIHHLLPGDLTHTVNSETLDDGSIIIVSANPASTIHMLTIVYLNRSEVANGAAS